MKRLGYGIWACILCATLVMAAPQTPTGDAGEKRTLTTSGTGKVTVTPDIARLSLTLETRDKSAGKATDQNNVKTQQLIQAMREGELAAEEDIQTQSFNIYPRQDWSPDGENLGIIYVVQHRLTVTVRDLNRIGDVLERAIAVDSNLFFSIYLDVADRGEPHAVALSGAVRDARNKASLIAEAAELELGDILKIQTLSGGIPVPEGGDTERAFDSSVPIAPGQTDITTQVLVVFEIR